MSTLDLVQYYANLLIKQYANLPNASGTVKSTVTPLLMPQTSTQSIKFAPAPTSGTFVLAYNGVNSSTINWNDSASTIQTDLRTIPALSQVTVSGSIAAGLIVTFVGFTVVAQLLTVFSSNLVSSGSPVVITIVETDLTLPLALQNIFNLTGQYTATGVQLDILGKYAGVTRTVSTPTQTIILNDTDFLTVIKFAIVQNNSGSSLQTIEQNLNIFFPGDFIVTDYKNMFMSYIFGTSIGSINLFTVLISEGLIPKPMGVGFSVIVPPVITQFFGFSTYEAGVSADNKPFNRYESFNTSWFFLTYEDFVY